MKIDILKKVMRKLETAATVDFLMAIQNFFNNF